MCCQAKFYSRKLVGVQSFRKTFFSYFLRSVGTQPNNILALLVVQCLHLKLDKKGSDHTSFSTYTVQIELCSKRNIGKLGLVTRFIHKPKQAKCSDYFLLKSFSYRISLAVIISVMFINNIFVFS